ncbi:hypothetical protein SAMN05216215_108927 [Saccharopolyspora shandongensis]|uniref:Uncharacterized protein n=1 Tax=Saccharopolyspora shandongensis TaxID=418495 RepID=A0A1H3TQE9_9PSEU|nr:hypothetical protein [Saccharopolyspora shandongensis]SDZ52464.1 hypothetical protein SAMN05216215_108927 [Saccharopolyspora shandongensis]
MIQFSDKGSAPVIAAMRLRAGSAGSGRGAAGSPGPDHRQGSRVWSAASFVPAGAYPSYHDCAKAGEAGKPQGRWVGWRCENLHNGQHQLWVQPKY